MTKTKLKAKTIFGASSETDLGVAMKMADGQKQMSNYPNWRVGTIDDILIDV